MKTTIATLTICGFMLSGLNTTITVGAQEKTSVKAGVYTEAQAKRGEELYKANCAACHGDDLAGSGPMPALAGPDFYVNWKTVGELFEKTQSSMPATAPGSLTGQQTSDILAYMLSVAKFPVGAAELAASHEELGQVEIEAPPAP